MQRLRAFWVYTCDRCNRKESKSAPMMNCRVMNRYGLRPPGWRFIDCKDFCDKCAIIVENAMGVQS